MMLAFALHMYSFDSVSTQVPPSGKEQAPLSDVPFRDLASGVKIKVSTRCCCVLHYSIIISACSTSQLQVSNAITEICCHTCAPPMQEFRTGTGSEEVRLFAIAAYTLASLSHILLKCVIAHAYVLLLHKD
jgi:hypothetical protein